MIRRYMIDFQANGWTAAGYLSAPEGSIGPGLVVIQEMWGLVDQIKGVADRFAAEGFVTLAPDLYHGDRAANPDDAGKLAMALGIAQAEKDLRGAVDHLHGLEMVRPKRVGLLGFCMGGQLALFAAVASGDRIAAAVDFYGFHPGVEVDATRLRAPVLAHFGKRDHLLPEASARRLVASLEAAGTAVEAHFYEAGHGFFDETRPHVYSPQAAALAWERTLRFLREQLR